MNSPPAFDWVDRSFRVDRTESFLRIQFVPIFVRDQDRSIKFFVDLLGFTVVLDVRILDGQRRVVIAPPDGTALLSLIAADEDSDEYQLIGRSGPIVLIAEDVAGKFSEWSSRGVHFRHSPGSWRMGGTAADFEDVDGNAFVLLGFDDLTRAIEAKRIALAEKLESERRTVRELEIAKEVQSRLFPQRRPPIRTLEYSGVCLQARQVGGDYYDFLDLGNERLGLVIADISGKGIGAALLMANLQANLRSQSAVAVNHPERLVRSVNQLFYENTPANAFASLFFSEYDDQKRCLRYANCGHLPALLLRSDGSLERLESTGTVLGLFSEWDGSIEEREFLAGDILVLYTDGVTESFNETGEELGEQQLIDVLQRHRDLPPPELLTSVLDLIRKFSAGEQFDDITLIVAKCRGID